MQVINSIGMNSDIFANSIKNNPITTEKTVDEKSSKLKFEDVIKEAVNKVNDSQVNANNSIQSLIKGEDITMHDVMLSVQESQMSMQLMLEVRNKLFEAYQELNRVQL